MNYQRCTKCVMDTTDPDIRFDASGVCNHCLTYDENEKKRRLAKPSYPWLLHDIKKQGAGKAYDVILGLSGGVDSSMCLHHLVQAGIRPLTFTIDNGWNTKEADENILNLVENLRVPFYRFTIDIELFRNVQQAFIASETPNVEIPTDHILSASSYQMAHDYSVKTIISGGNLSTESIMPPAWGYNARDLTFIKDVCRQYGITNLTGIPTISLRKYLIRRFWNGIKVVNLLDYHEYNRAESKKLLSQLYGWKDYGEKHEESHFTKWFQNEYLIELGIDKRKAHYSSLILSGQMKRETALAFLTNSPAELKLKKTHHDYKNSEALWNRLSRIYSRLK